MIDVLADYPNLPPDEAMQAAIENGGLVYAPPPTTGEYLLDLGTLRTRGRLKLMVDPRVTVKRTQSIGMFRNWFEGQDPTPGYSGYGDLEVEGGVWDANGATGPAASAFSISHAENVVLRNLTIRNVPGSHGADLMACRRVLIERVTFEGYRDTGTAEDPRNFSEGVQVDGAYGTGYGGTWTPFDNTACEDVRVVGCTFRASDTLGPWGRAVGSHGYAADVAGHEHRNIRVVDNTIHGTLTDAIWAWKWGESVIRENHIYDPGYSGVVAKDGSWDIDIGHNHVYGAGRHGLWVDGGCHNITISDENKVVGASASQHNTYDGIRVSGGCVTMKITDNRVRRSGGPKDTRWGLNIDAGQQRMVHHGNYLTWSGASGSVRDLSTSPVTSAADTV